MWYCPAFHSEKNIKQNVIRVDTPKYINISYVPPYIYQHFIRLLNYRTKVEQRFSPARILYQAYCMVNRGYENAVCNVAKLKIIELLMALTAVKVHRPDLINSPTAFYDLSPEIEMLLHEKSIQQGGGVCIGKML